MADAQSKGIDIFRRGPRRLLAYAAGLTCLLLGLFFVTSYMRPQISRWACQVGLDTMVSEECFIDRANGARVRGLFAQAVANWTKAITLNPNNYQLYLDRGIDYSYRSRFGAAVSDFTKVIAMQPGLAAGYVLRGIAYASEGQYGNAILDETKALDVDARYKFFALEARGEALTFANRPREAIVNLSQAIALDPHKAKAYVYSIRAIAYDEAGAHDRAKKDYFVALVLIDDGIAKSPRDGLLYAERGLIYGRTGHEREAIDDETHAIALHCLGPADAYVYRALAHDSRGEHREAVADLQYAIRYNKFAKLEWDRLKSIRSAP